MVYIIRLSNLRILIPKVGGVDHSETSAAHVVRIRQNCVFKLSHLTVSPSFAEASTIMTQGFFPRQSSIFWVSGSTVAQGLALFLERLLRNSCLVRHRQGLMKWRVYRVCTQSETISESFHSYFVSHQTRMAIYWAGRTLVRSRNPKSSTTTVFKLRDMYQRFCHGSPRGVLRGFHLFKFTFHHLRKLWFF